MALHVRPGEDILDKLTEGHVGGDRASWSDPLCEGPIRRWATDLDRKRDRAIHLSSRYFLSYGEVLRHLGMQDNAIDDAAHYQETVLWFEHDLFDQMILVFLLCRLAPLVRGGRVSLIARHEHRAVERFVGFGQLNPEQLAELVPTRVAVTVEQLRLARKTWKALEAETPTALSRLAKSDRPSLPYLPAAIGRYLAEYPSVDSGLSSTEQLGLAAIGAGAKTPMAAFEAVQARETAPFQGDSMFFAALRGLGEGPKPLLARREGSSPPLAKLRDDRFRVEPLRLTPAGEAVLVGRSDWFRLNGASRWIGGVHLIGPEPRWRYDRVAATVVESA